MAKYNSRLSVLKFYIPSSIRGHLCLLFISCLISASFSFLLIYSNIHDIGLFFTSLFAPISFNLALSRSAESYAGRKAGLSVYDQNILYNDFDYLNNSTLTFEKRIYSTNIQVLYRLPKKIPIFALLLIFHGCSRSANDWFTTIERQRIVGAAVDLGYGCLAFQSTDQLSRCWSSESELSQNPDVQMVWNGLDEFYKEHPTLKSLPRFTFGASSGGIFSSVFATNSRDKIQGQIIFISIVLPDVLETHVKKGNYPSTAWIYMTRDTEFASEARINESMKIFAQHNIPHISFAITPIPITATIFHERIPTITKETSKHIVYLLQSKNWLDADAYLRYNPRRRNTWRDFIFLTSNKTITSTSILDNLNAHQNVLPDFFNTLYGEHEISFERSLEALQWHQRISKSKQNFTS